MMIKKYIRFCCFLLALFMLVLALPLSVAAASVPSFVSIDDSDVMDDLKRIGIDVQDYKKDADADHIRMLYFLEYGYDYYGNTSDYGLYMYLWNPTGKEIDMSSTENFLEMYVSSNDQKLTDTKKYYLELLDYSDIAGYERVFYKFKIKGVKDLASKVSRGKRSYDIVGVELVHMGDLRAKDYKIAGKYSFTGFIPYHGADRSANNTLYQYVTDIISVDLNLHPFSWKTKSSDKGAGWQYELSSVYFSVPADIIRDYGDKDHETKGLVSVRGTYNEQGINGFVTNSSAAYQTAMDAVGKDPRKDSVSLKFAGAYRTDNGGILTGPTYWGGFDFNDYNPASLRQNCKNKYALCSAVEYSGFFNEISQSDFLAALDKVWDEKGKYYVRVDDGRTQGFQEYLISVDDGDLATKIQTYASNHNGFISWLKGEFDCFDTKESYTGMEPIECMTSSKMSALYNDEYLSSTYFIEESEVSSLRKLISSDELKNRVPYLLRFAITDYYFESCGAKKDNARLSGDHYYFEKTIFKNFDILELTYQDEYHKTVTLPVVCSPIDAVGSLTPTRPGQTGGVLENLVQKGRDLSKYNVLLILILGVLLIVTLLLLIKPLRNLIRKLFKWLGRKKRKVSGKIKMRRQKNKVRRKIRKYSKRKER